MTNFQNPLGSLMPEAKKKALVELLTRHEVPLIEDDVYGELYFGDKRPLPAKAFDTAGAGDALLVVLEVPGARLPHRLGRAGTLHPRSGARRS